MGEHGPEPPSLGWVLGSMPSTNKKNDQVKLGKLFMISLTLLDHFFFVRLFVVGGDQLENFKITREGGKNFQ